MEQAKHLDRSISQILNINLTNALKIAGPEDERCRPTRLKKVAVFRSTGLARSTLDDLLKACANGSANPDLRTLCILADELHIPVAFLLMGPRQWSTLLKAFDDVLNSEIRDAAMKQDKARELSEPQSALNVLKEAKLWPMPRPQLPDARDAAEEAEQDRKDEAMRRATLVTAALMQAGADSAVMTVLTTLAASHANQDKSRYLNSL